MKRRRRTSIAGPVVGRGKGHAAKGTVCGGLKASL